MKRFQKISFVQSLRNLRGQSQDIFVFGIFIKQLLLVLRVILSFLHYLLSYFHSILTIRFPGQRIVDTTQCPGVRIVFLLHYLMLHSALDTG